MLGTFREPESCFEVAVREFTVPYVKTVREGVGRGPSEEPKGVISEDNDLFFFRSAEI
jgi:hypothetical protein